MHGPMDVKFLQGVIFAYILFGVVFTAQHIKCKLLRCSTQAAAVQYLTVFRYVYVSFIQLFVTTVPSTFPKQFAHTIRSSIPP